MLDKKLKSLINFNLNNTKSKFKYPLLNQGFNFNDIQKGIEVLMSGQITMSSITRKFEKEFARKVGSKFAIMVNSGSSANLLAAFASCNPMRKNKFKVGDEMLIPAICWSTSLWPFVQAGLKPIFVDSDINSLNIDLNDFNTGFFKVGNFVSNR